MITKEQKQALEALIDAHGLSAVLDTLEEISQEKADHIRANWQDESLARRWERVCARLSQSSNYARKELP